MDRCLLGKSCLVTTDPCPSFDPGRERSLDPARRAATVVSMPLVRRRGTRAPTALVKHRRPFGHRRGAR